MRSAVVNCMTAVLLCAFASTEVLARSGSKDTGTATYIVELADPPLANYDGRALSAPRDDGSPTMPATSPPYTGKQRLDPRAPESRAYLDYLEDRHATFELEATILLKRPVQAKRHYRFATNGMAVRLSPQEAEELRSSPLVRAVQRDRKHKLETFAGPPWIGADAIWNGNNDTGSAQGEGVIMGIIDTGINWEHPSFADLSGDGYNHTNPYGQQLGLCNMAQVECNDKLVGVYDFVEFDPNDDDSDENTNGRDDNGHGSHVAGIAAGNRLFVILNDSDETVLSGVAPRANIITYRVGGNNCCQGEAILDAIDQAVEDGVDVINYSIGSDPVHPWAGGTVPAAYLGARNAGIIVVTSAGNEGPASSSIGSPANAPWVIAVGNATHNGVFGSVVEDLSGGNFGPPGDMLGASLTDGIGVRDIVHAKDFGSALCGTGVAESQPDCEGNTGLSSPWGNDVVFNGEIVVCDRGTYGRVEKGKNVMLAGAGGYILANTDAQGESIVADAHCLPASHIGDTDGDELRNWLNNGDGHQGSISGFSLVLADEFADQLYVSSSRGPVESPVQDILKPNMIAPGTSILSASHEEEEFNLLTGTSMSSPHVAGAAALLKSLHPSWSTAQIASSLDSTSTPELVTDEGVGFAGPHERGAGRPQLGDAADAGLFFNVTALDWSVQNPNTGGEPKEINLPSFVDTRCTGTCSFTRTVTDQNNGASWQASAIEFPAAVDVTVQPSSFTLASGASRTLEVDLDLRASGMVGNWVYGRIRLSSTGLPNQFITVAVFYDGGSLPDAWNINSDEGAGSTQATYSGLIDMPDATFTSGGLIAPTITTQTIVQDPTADDPSIENDDPFDGGEGTFTVWHEVPEGALWLHSETLESSAVDLDLFVGRDENEDGVTDQSELLCSSTSSIDLELCDIFTPPPGDYWIIVQNWKEGNAEGDEATLVSGVVGSEDSSDLVASGPGIIPEGDSFDLRLSWSNVSARPGEEWLGAVGIGTDRANPNNVAVIPVFFRRDGVGEVETIALMAGMERKLAIDGNSSHDRIYIDIPPGVNTLNISAEGDSSSESNNLSFDLYRQDFEDALDSPPFVELPDGLVPVGSAEGGNGVGPGIVINDHVPPGRYFLDVSNTRNSPSSVTISTVVSSDPTELSPHKGLWDFDRNIAQGAEWNSAGNFSFAVWYAYDDEGQPTWYIASGPSPVGNIWVADLLRVTNDGEEQQEKIVGKVSMTFLSDTEVVMSYIIFGKSGFDPMHPNGPNSCPDIGGIKSYTGHWYRGIAGLGGSTVLVYDGAQAQVHYLFDVIGVPRWLIAADDENQSSTAETIPLLQFKGFCAACSPQAVSFDTAGEVTRSFANETTGGWTLDFDLLAPLSQTIDRTDDIIKLSDTLVCE